MTRRVTKSHPLAGVKALDAAAGVFEAYVSVFGNVDLQGDRILPDAFDASIAALKAAEHPLPVIFSHQWDNLNAWLGHVPPDGLEAVPAGDPRLPAELADFGGLKAELHFDLADPMGRKAATLLSSKALREFSFAYDVHDEERGDDGANDLKRLDILETGPTLKGANPLTQLAKSLTGAPARSRSKTKARVSVPGSIELHIEAVRSAVVGWALDLFGSELYTAFIEATFADNVLAYVELWEEPIDGGTYYRIPYTADGDDIELGEVQAVNFEVSIEPRAAATRARAKAIHDALTGPPPATKSDDLDDDADVSDGNPEPESTAPGPILVSIEAELLDL